jgi:predicted DNA-binding protein (UPF0251 family)
MSAESAGRALRAAMLVEAGTHTQAEAARELEISRQAVGQALARRRRRAAREERC